MTGWYLAALVVSLGSMVAMDRRWSLFFWADRRSAGIVLAIGVAVLLTWDGTAIALGIFERGLGAGLTGIEVAPHLPLEELFFVTFLCYLTMVVYGLAVRMLATFSRTRPTYAEVVE